MKSLLHDICQESAARNVKIITIIVSFLWNLQTSFNPITVIALGTNARELKPCMRARLFRNGFYG